MNKHFMGRLHERMKHAATVKEVRDKFCCLTWGTVDGMYRHMNLLESKLEHTEEAYGIATKALERVRDTYFVVQIKGEKEGEWLDRELSAEKVFVTQALLEAKGALKYE